MYHSNCGFLYSIAFHREKNSVSSCEILVPDRDQEPYLEPFLKPIPDFSIPNREITFSFPATAFLVIPELNPDMVPDFGFRIREPFWEPFREWVLILNFVNPKIVPDMAPEMVPVMVSDFGIRIRKRFWEPLNLLAKLSIPKWFQILIPEIFAQKWNFVHCVS